MHDLTKDMRASQAARAVAGWARQAVESLRDGEVHDPESLTELGSEGAAAPKDFLETLFGELPQRFQPAELDKPISWYFSLGDDRRWTVEVDSDGCRVSRGRPAAGSADCVVKTSPEIVEKIIRKAYVPEVPEFVSGKIKTNEIPLLMAFSKVFKLGERS